MAFLRQQNTQSVPGFSPEETAALISSSRSSGSPLLAQLIRGGGQDRIRQIDDAVGEDVPRRTYRPSEEVPSKQVATTAELLRRIDALRVQPEAKKSERIAIPVEAVTVHGKDGDELKYRDKKTGKIYDYDPND
jgi:hypothetical protein